MKKIYSIIFVVLFCLSLTYAQNTPFKQEQQIDIAYSIDNHIAFPDAAVLANGDIMVVYREGSNHYQTGRLMKVFSSDHGFSWSEPEVLYDDTEIDDRDPSITVLKSGKILLTFFKYIKGVKDSIPGNHQVFWAYSTDNGTSFSEPQQINKEPLYIQNPTLKDSAYWINDKHKMIQVEAVSSPILEYNNNLYLFTYGGTPLFYENKNKMLSPSNKINIYQKSLKSKKWTKITSFPFNLPEIWPSEPFVLPIGENQFLMHIRTGKNTPFAQGNMLQTISIDGGLSWSALRNLNIVGHAPYLHQLYNGYIISAFRLVDYTEMKEKTAYIYSQDKGQTWSEPVIVEDCGNGECGYPSIIDLDEQHFLMVYYCDNGKSIKGTVFSY